MSRLFAKKSWSPYLVGVGIGVLSWFAFWSADHPLGITTSFEHTAALAMEAALPALAESNSYYQEQSPSSFELAVLADLLFDGRSDRVPSVWE